VRRNDLVGHFRSTNLDQRINGAQQNLVGKSVYRRILGVQIEGSPNRSSNTLGPSAIGTPVAIRGRADTPRRCMKRPENVFQPAAVSVGAPPRSVTWPLPDFGSSPLALQKRETFGELPPTILLAWSRSEGDRLWLVPRSIASLA
jgi:hypothetical protein